MPNQLQELRQRGLRLKRSLGQNLMLDASLCGKIVRAADVREGERVLEIGPGLGALTEAILARKADVLAVEMDQRLLPVLEERFHGRPGLALVHADILKFPLESLVAFAGGRKVKVVSNLPFYNSSQILFYLAERRAHIESAVVTLQKEMAERLVAPPGGKEYGILSVRLQAVADLKMLFPISSSVFFPRPKVDSAAVLLDFRADRLPAGLSEETFARCVRAAFGQRRKMLSNTLGAVYGAGPARAALSECGIDPSKRAENLSVEDYFRLAAALKNF